MSGPVMWRAVGDISCEHDWYMVGATTATDGWGCVCGARAETWAEHGPPASRIDDHQYAALSGRAS